MRRCQMAMPLFCLRNNMSWKNLSIKFRKYRKQLKNYYLNRGFTCEVLENTGGRCISATNSVKTTFYRYDDGFRYTIKTEGYSLDIMHRLSEEDINIIKQTLMEIIHRCVLKQLLL